ncbi:hypothetical protein FB479_102920 [Brevibacillus sp. AG162]|uniref:hypothetical protein n=1 Tax=Brevibacillus sp. AG162 TaxID=2572910 RepID=UPI00114FA480|nr:hypothetical protein [Brevibacillus sp. AG162]TQK74277.1 hypothetical protein FB479_102920 [Brevibacillus sp. AG162]
MKKKNIIVIGAILAITTIATPTVFIINHASNIDSPSNYPVNEQGQSFGAGPFPEGASQEPDLIKAEGEKGVEGYVRSSDLSPAVSTPEEAIAFQKIIEATGFRSIPLYKSDGKTVIGEFRLYSSNKINEIKQN